MAVRKKKSGAYTFAELSEEAQDRAIRTYRDRKSDRLFDHDDAQFLTEQFQNDLKDHYGLGDFKAYWTLGHCQGDGVCFEGTVDMETFLKAEKKKKLFGPLVGLVYAKVKHESRNCHWNSMTVEVEFDGNVSPADLLPEELREVHEDWKASLRARTRKALEVEFRRTQPVREWQAQVARWREEMQKKYRVKQDWTPRVDEPGPQPQELDIPLPPIVEIPDDLKAALDEAAIVFQTLEKKVKEFEEYLTGRVTEISKELEENGYAEIDHHYSDEYIAERLTDEGEEYNEDGTVYDGN